MVAKRLKDVRCIESGASALKDRLSCTVSHNARGCGTWQTPQHKTLALPYLLFESKGLCSVSEGRGRRIFHVEGKADSGLDEP